MRCKFLLSAVLLSSFVMPARADLMYSDLATWQAAVGTSTETTSYGTEGRFGNITSFSLAGGPTISGNFVTIRTVPSSWNYWCCGYTGQVLYDGNLTYSGTLSSAVGGMGMYI